jgi:Flp pilus assembly protein TadG
MDLSERGNASVEFIGIAVAMMVPLAYAIIAMAQVQSAVYGINGAAQMAARAFVQATNDSTGRFAAARSAAIAGRNHGLMIAASDVAVVCDVANCLTPGTTVRVTVRTTARISAAGFSKSLPLSASRLFVVDPYRQLPS